MEHLDKKCEKLEKLNKKLKTTMHIKHDDIYHVSRWKYQTL